MAVHGNTKKYKIYKMRKNDSAKTNGFYNNSNVIRIECELRGVGLVPYSAFEASKVRDGRLEPVQHYGMNNEYPQGFEVIFSDLWST